MIKTAFMKKMPRFLLIAGILVILLSATSALAAGGTLDPTFGSNGIVTTKYNDQSSSANEVVLQADGKIVVLESAKVSEDQSVKVITRYNSNGTLDTSFGVNGSMPIEIELFNASKIALQPDGKLIVGGTNWRGYFAVARYNSNGTLDTSFGTNGLGVYDWSYNEFHQSLADMTVQADGKIVLVGDYTAGQSNYADFSFARFNSDGTKDIGNNMISFTNSRFNYAKAVVIQPDGKILISGNMQDDDGKNQISLARLNPDGSLDKSTFGNGSGTVITRLDFQNGSGALALQSDGKIVVAGNNFTSGNPTLVRYHANGTLDTSFGGTGIVDTDFGADELLDDFVIQPDGKILVEGKTSSLDTSDFLLVRYNSDGSPDTSFGTNGKVTTDFGNTADFARGIALQADGKAIVIGSKGTDGILARYDTGLSMTPTTLTFDSVGAYDGWILEFLENSNKGGTLEKKSNLMYVGDDAKDRQYRGILSFNTDSIPDNATITSAQVKIKRQSYVGTNPVNTHGALLLEIRNGTFNNDIALTLEDFAAPASSGSTQDTFSGADANFVHTATLSNANLGLINKAGVTQFRVLFSKDDNDDQDADYFKLFTGNSDNDHPKLVLTYSTAGPGPTNQPPAITSNGGGGTADISLPENTTAVTTVTATDPDGQTLAYSISGGADAALFSINPSVGTLSFVTAPSYSAPNDAGLDHIYNVTVQASDGTLTDSQELVISILPPNPPPASPLDTTFGTSGVAATKFNGLTSSTRDIVLQPDGKIVVLGDMQSTRVVARYNSNGSTDTSFGTNGIVANTFPSFSGKALALQPDGKLVVAGLQKNFAAVRYNSNGTLDTSFGANGLAALDPVNISTDISYFVEDATIQPDGKIVMAGSYSIGNHIEIEVVRFNSDGTRDAINPLDWGTFGSQYNYGKAVVLQPDNKIVVSGDMVSCCDNYQYISLARLNPDFRLDRSTFGSGKGVATAPLNRFQNGNGALALQPDGKIVVAGYVLGADWETPQNLALARFNSDSTLDTTFGGTGIVVTDFGAEESTASLVIQASGKIIVAGTTSSAGASDFLLVRYNGDGSLDTSFGTGGKLVTDLGNTNDAITGIVQQYDGKVVVSGNSGENAILARYNTGTTTSGGPTASLSFNSVGAYDGWILESGEFSAIGGSLDKISNVVYAGDDAKDRQYRSILSFNTDSIPDNATIVSAQVKVRKQGVTGTDPFGTHGNLLLEIRNGTFNNDIALSLGDFSAAADSGSSQDKFTAADSGWYTASLGNANLALLNKYGVTQFRLLFSKDDNDDMSADYAKFFSGNSTSDLPQLVVTYSTGGGGGTNQAPVIFGGASLSVSAPENTTAVARVTALDPDGQLLTYSLSGADAGKFSINAGTGILSFVTAPDFEAIPSGTVYHVTVQVSDGSLTSTQEVSVTVTPVNEFAPVVTSSAGTNISVPENTTDIATITVTDADLPAPSLQYEIGGVDGQLLSFDSATGKLSFITPPIYSAPNDAGADHVYNFMLGVYDSDLGTPLEFVITITDSNVPTGEMLDLTFGTNGVISTKFDNRPNFVLGIGLQPDGRIVVLESIKVNDDINDYTYRKVLARYTQNGILDTSFGTNGITPIEIASFSPTTIEIQADGKIVLGAGSGQVAVARYNNNGTLDATFGINGSNSLNMNDHHTYITDAAIQTDGKIVLVGNDTQGQANYTEVFVARFTSNGQVDNTFVGNGFNIIDTIPNYRYAGGAAVAIQNDGKIVISGDMMDNDGKTDLILVRLNQDGLLDRTGFGANGNGTVSTLIPNFQTNVGALALQADGKIVVVGTSNDNLILARYNTNGVLDATLGGTGIVTTDFGSTEEANDLVVQADGKILVVGSIPAPEYKGFLLVRYNPDGSLDTSFGTNGKAITRLGSINSTATTILQQADGKILVGGHSSVNGVSWDNGYLARYDIGTPASTNILAFKSVGTQDGWILESGENTNQGGTLEKVSNAIFVGDDARDRQYRSILSFDTNSIPDNAILASAQLKIRKQGVVGSDPLGTHGDLLLEIRNGAFSNSATLNVEDFSATAEVGSTQDKFLATDSDWRVASLSSVNLGSINRYGVTQFRLLFSKDDNDDLDADYDRFFSGNADSGQPELTVTYSLPGNSAAKMTTTALAAPPEPTPIPTPETTAAAAAPSQFTVLHQFGGQSNNGRVPYGTLVAYNGVFYGTTTYGGPPYDVPPTNPDNKGNLFRMNMDGTGFTVLHEFAGGANDGWKPWSGLAMLGNTIYGSTVYGGPHGEGGGVIYEINLDGSGFRVLHAFGEPGDGFGGSTSPILVGDVLYGLTRWGGNGTGTIYSYNTTTEVYTQLYRFAANSSDGNAPLGTLTTANDGYLYGTTWLGGRNNMGTLFRIKPDGSAFETLHHFDGGSQGKYPYDTLVFDGNHTLYGTTLGEYGVNLSDLGTVFKYDITNRTYSVLHKFAGGENDSGKPNGSVVLSSDGVTLYGTTHGDDAWGGNEYGVLYRMNLDGTGFTQLHEFKGGAIGATPMRTPLLIDGGVYGMTAYGGAENYGLVYRYQLDDATATQRIAPLAISVNTSPGITSSSTVSVAENNLAALNVTATDADIPTQALTYSISSGADAGLFSINPSTGELVFAAKPDYEAPADAGRDNIYNLTVQVSDGTATAAQEVTVTVNSANDNSPVVTSGNAISVSENTTAVLNVTATDADIPSQPLTYSIVGGADAARFAINSSTGELTFVSAPDFDLPSDAGADNAYNITVQASDGELVGVQDVTVTIVPVNDNAPVITSIANPSVAENNPVVTTVTATDADLPPQPLTYSIAGGADSTLFTVNPSTGELTFVSAADYEAPKDAGTNNVYNVTVQASDGTLTVSQDVVVTVTPVNDNMPVITSPASFSIPENTTVVTTVIATDADLPAQPLTFSIVSGADAMLFTINPSTGALDFVTARDFEAPNDAGGDNVYNLMIQVSDGAFNLTKELTVTVLPVNDNAPVVILPDKFSIPENTTTIATLTATDADRPAQPLTYSIIGGADTAKFSIVSATGELTFATAPDFETPTDSNLDNIYELIIQVSDGTTNVTKNISVQVMFRAG
ncbi:MAG: cadherin domain-containing protein [Chloroflexi bacterium]|nr:cadherin domain-containing protein [Chloroflexota bacterium]